jgi:hypothetical protein
MSLLGMIGINFGMIGAFVALLACKVVKDFRTLDKTG